MRKHSPKLMLGVCFFGLYSAGKRQSQMIDKHLKINHLSYHIAATEALIFEVETFITGDAAAERSRIGH